jgi:hypothetical protein
MVAARQAATETRDRVRACPCSKPSGPGQARTHDGQDQQRRLPSAESGQVSSYLTARGQAGCKTVGSAYVGSNPTPATSSRDGP